MEKQIFSFLTGLLLFIAKVNAQLVIVPGTFPSMDQGGNYVTQRTAIIITETLQGDFAVTPGIETYVITAPAGYEFKPNTGSFIPLDGCVFNCINISDLYSGAMSVTSTTITLNLRFMSAIYAEDTIRITNLQVRALAGASITANLLRTGGTAVYNGGNPSDAKVHATFCSANNAVPIITYIPDPYYCRGENTSYTLTAFPTGGTWTGTGVTGGNFNPYGLPPSTIKIKYTLVTGICYNADSINVLVKPSYPVTITCNDLDNTICAGQSVTFTGNIPGTPKRLQFYKNDIPVTTLSSGTTYTTTTLVNGDRIKVVADNGAFTCPDTSAEITMTVGEYPTALFEWQNSCGQTDVTFKDLSTATGSTLVNHQWDYTNDGTFDYSQLNALPDVLHNYPSTNEYQAKLRVTTDKGCFKDTVIRVYTLPGYTPTPTDPYAVNFISSNQGWAYDGVNATWGWGVAHLSFGSGTRPIWSTGQNSPDGKYKTAEQSYLYGPCLNLSQLDKPMLAFKLSSKITDKPAGAILEITTDDGLNWHKVGALGEGINWYNQLGIVSTPNTNLANLTPNNPDAQGWTDDINFNNNNLSRISLQRFAGQPSVRIRINFESVADAEAARFAGIGLDSVWVGNREKIVVLEHFTNDACKADTICAYANNSVYSLYNQRKLDMVPVFIHSSIGGVDQYNSFNPQDPSARFLHYSATVIPVSILDGNALTTSHYGSTGLDSTAVDKQTLLTPKFKVDLTTEITPGKIKASARLTAKEFIDNSSGNRNVLLHIVVTEDSTNGNNTVNHTLRKMLPDAAGTYINKTWQEGDTFSVAQTWIHNLSGTRKFNVIAFAQFHRAEIAQAAIVRGEGTSGEVVITSSHDILETDQIIVYPNPSSEELIVHLHTSQNCNWQIFDNIGKLMSNGRIMNESEIRINTTDFSNGGYLIKINNEAGSVVKKFNVVH